MHIVRTQIVALLIFGTAFLALTPTADAAVFEGRAVLCPYSSPIPGAPVGGEVGAIYTTAKSGADTIVGGVTSSGCNTLDHVAQQINPQCQFLIGQDCI